MANSEWHKVGLIKTGKTGNKYLALGTPKSKYKPVNVELVVKDLSGNVLATVVNPNLNCSDPRKRPGLTEEQKNFIPEYVVAEITLPPDKE